MMRLRAIILGCGSSAGCPRIGGEDGFGDWGACDPNEPKNRRTRCSILIQRAHDEHGWNTKDLTTILVDTSPELRLQMTSVGVARVDAVLITHDHADQTHGIDDLRVLAYTGRRRVPVYIDADTAPDIQERFAYCFADNPKTGYPAILEACNMPAPGVNFAIDGPSGPIPVTSFLQEHGPVQSLGFRFGGPGGIAYSSDTNDLPPESFDQLQTLGAWIVDALRYEPHVSHAHLEKAVSWVSQVGATRGVLTNMHIDMDYQTVRTETPDHIEPAFDGMIVEVNANDVAHD